MRRHWQGAAAGPPLWGEAGPALCSTQLAPGGSNSPIPGHNWDPHPCQWSLCENYVRVKLCTTVREEVWETALWAPRWDKEEGDEARGQRFPCRPQRRDHGGVDWVFPEPVAHGGAGLSIGTEIAALANNPQWSKRKLLPFPKATQWVVRNEAQSEKKSRIGRDVF